MAKDYPDYTRAHQIIGSNVMVPMDIQGAYIMMPVDIQAQYVNVEIDIVAQSVGNIAIDLAAQSVGNIQIDVAAQTVGNLTIDINAQHVGMYLTPDWNVLAGNQKYFRATDPDVARAGYAGGTYTPGTGKTLYITHFGGGTHAVTAENSDLPQIMFCMIYKVVDETPTIFAELGGNGGSGMVLPTPAKILAGEEFRYRVYNYANHNVIAYVTAGGYEI